MERITQTKFKYFYGGLAIEGKEPLRTWLRVAVQLVLRGKMEKKVVCYNTRLPTTILPRFTGKVRE